MYLGNLFAAVAILVGKNGTMRSVVGCEHRAIVRTFIPNTLCLIQMHSQTFYLLLINE